MYTALHWLTSCAFPAQKKIKVDGPVVEMDGEAAQLSDDEEAMYTDV